MRIVKPLLKTTFAALAVFAVQKFCHRQTDGFQLTKIRSNISSLSEQEHQSSTSIQEILKQQFTYLGSGGQCYAFLSEDKKTVLKLFKMHHLEQHKWIQYLALPGILDSWRLKVIAVQKQKIEKFFESNTLAWSTLKEESGLIHLCLNPPEKSPYTTTLIDKLNISHTISLDKIPFALQHYAENPFKKLRTHIARKEMAEAKAIVKNIVDILKQRYEKGIGDLDPALRRNVGLLDDKAIFIDIGAFVPDLKTINQKELLWSETRRMDRWLDKRAPELKEYLDSLIAESPTAIE